VLLRRGGAESFARGEKGGGLQCGVADISPPHDPAQCGRNGKIVAAGSRAALSSSFTIICVRMGDSNHLLRAAVP
jgi:hypothetical protein